MNSTIILRHADREQIEDANKMHLAQVTFNGKIKSLWQGIFLKRSFSDIREIHTSSSERCIETANIIAHILSPFNKPKIVISKDVYEFFSTGYVQPGKFDEWCKYMLEYQQHKIDTYKIIFERMKELGLLRYSLKEYKAEMIEKYLRSYNLLAITHDTTIGPLIEALAEDYGFKVHGNMINPSPLSGFYIVHDNGRISTIKWLEYGKDPIVLW